MPINIAARLLLKAGTQAPGVPSPGQVPNAPAAHWVFGGPLTMSGWLGIGFIVLGVWPVARA